MGKNSYSAVKGRFIQARLNEGFDKKKANKQWCKSTEKKAFDLYPGNVTIEDFRGNVDRSHESPMQDWAETSEDF